MKSLCKWTAQRVYIKPTCPNTGVGSVFHSLALDYPLGRGNIFNWIRRPFWCLIIWNPIHLKRHMLVHSTERQLWKPWLYFEDLISPELHDVSLLLCVLAHFSWSVTPGGVLKGDLLWNWFLIDWNDLFDNVLFFCVWNKTCHDQDWYEMSY